MNERPHRNRTARFAPAPAAKTSLASEATTRAWQIMRAEFGAHHPVEPPDFLLVVEGRTDLGYLRRAAQLVSEAGGDDPLSVPESLRHSGNDRIALLVPGEPGKMGGGAERMVVLARDVFRDVFGGNQMRIGFVFDHDYAGRRARDEIQRYGFKQDVHSLTLDPAAHPDACPCRDSASAGTAIEDLLSLAFQQQFFDRGSASCDLEYQAGVLTRFRWFSPSKRLLSQFAEQHATLEDVAEVVRLLARIRHMFGFPT